MERIHIKELVTKIGETVLVQGFIHAIRDQGGIKFLVLRDTTGHVQVVVLKSSKEVFDAVPNLTIESVISIEGLVKEEKQAPGGFEIEARSLEVLSLAAPELPIPVVVEKGGEETEQAKRYDWRWLDLRKEGRLDIFRLWTSLETGLRDYLLSQNFIQAYAPSLMSTPSESGSEVFEVAYFDRKAYLAQSPQFYKQMAMAAGFERVLMIGPVFRAEPSFTTRHATEFTGWDFEMSYIFSPFDVMRMAEGALIAAFQKAKEDLDIGIEVPANNFPMITMAEAKEKLKTAGVKSDKAGDVSPEEERELCRIIKEETGHDFLWLTDYPVEVRPFYHMRYENTEVTKSFDLLYRGVEVITGAQREHRYEVLKLQAEEKGMDLGSLQNYLNFFKYGCPPHGGVGMGPSRIVMKILDLPTIKDTVLLPRDVNRLTP